MNYSIGKISENIITEAIKQNNIKIIKYNKSNLLQKYKKLIHICKDKLKYMCKGYKCAQLTCPSSGSSGKQNPTTADIILLKDKSDKNGLHISVKHNNFSMKHQRPHMLYRQVKMDRRQSALFINDYSKIVNYWILKWKRKYNMYSEIPITQKHKLYSEINTLTVNYLNKNIINLKRYINFIIDQKTKYIIHLNIHQNKCDIFKKRHIVLDPKITMDNGFVFIHLNKNNANTPKIRLRIHTCKNKFDGKTIHVKYDSILYGYMLAHL